MSPNVQWYFPFIEHLAQNTIILITLSNIHSWNCRHVLNSQSFWEMLFPAWRWHPTIRSSPKAFPSLDSFLLRTSAKSSSASRSSLLGHLSGHLFIPNPLPQERQNNARLDDKAFSTICLVSTQSTRNPASAGHPLWLSQLMQLSQHRTLLIISHIPHSNSSALFHWILLHGFLCQK